MYQWKFFTHLTTIIFLSSSINAQPSLPQDTSPASERLQWMENTIDTYVEENNIPALVVGIVRDGAVEAYISKGTIKRGSKQLVDQQTAFQLASLTKTFTGIIANHLIAAGKLDVHASITEYLPPSLSEAAREKLSAITLKDVLHHCSGLPRNAQNEPNTPWGLPLKADDYDEAMLLENLELLALQSKPGETWAYSNFGYSLMGYIMERVSGRSYETLLQEYIGKNYDLQHTTTDLGKAREIGLARPYRTDWRFLKTRPWKFGKLVAAGGAFSTVADLCKLMIRQMEAYEAFHAKGMASPLILTQDKRPMGKSGHPYYGYGFFERQSSIDSTIVHLGHGGDVDGFVSNYSFVPGRQLGIVMLSSSGGQWFWELERQLMQKALDLPVREEVAVSKKVLKRYVGTYDFGDDQIIKIVRKGDELWSKRRGFPSHQLFPEAENKFFFKAYDGQYEFLLDENNEVVKTIYTQQGKVVYPDKVK